METLHEYRLFKVARDLGVGSAYIVQFLEAFGFAVNNSPNEKLSEEMTRLVQVLLHETSSKWNEDQHARFLKRRGFDISKVATILEPEALKVLRSKGNWFQALTDGEIVPTTLEEMDFVRAARGELEPYTKEEFLWCAYLSANQVQSEISAARIIDSELSEWERCKHKYPIGSVHEFVVSMKIPNAWVVMEMEGGFQGMLHLSELDWNLASSQSQFFQLQERDICKSVVVGHENERIQLSRKKLYPLPNERSGWKGFKRGKSLVKCRISERTASRLIVELPGHYYGYIPIDDLPKEDRLTTATIGAEVKLVVLDRDEHLGMIKLGSPDMLRVENIKPQALGQDSNIHLEKVVDMGPQLFGAVDSRLRSLSDLQRSIWWRYLEEVEQEYLTTAFRKNGRLFSNVHKGVHELVVSFDVANPGLWDQFRSQIAPILIGTLAEDIARETLALEGLSKQAFWFNSFQKEGMEFPQFRIFNERFSITGLFNERNGRFSIETLKANHLDKALTEKQHSFRHDCISLDLPIRFSSPYQDAGDVGVQKRYFEVLKEKLESFKILRQVVHKTGAIVNRKGKDFQIFQDFLMSQMEYEGMQEEGRVTPFRSAQVAPEQSFRNLETILVAESEQEIPFERGDVMELFRLVPQFGRTEMKEEDLGVAIFDDVFGNKALLNIANLDPAIFSEGFVARRRVNTKQHRVQANLIDDYFQNRIVIPHFDDILHRPDEITPPSQKEVQFKDPNIAAEPNGKQAQAVRVGLGNQNVVLIQGPPGTGKTTVISEIVQQAVAEGKRILVCSPTHVAVDAVLRKLINVERIQLGRIGKPKDPSLNEFTLENQLSEFSNSFSSLLHIQSKLAKDLVIANENLRASIIHQATSELRELLNKDLGGARKNSYFEKQLSQFSIEVMALDSESLKEIIPLQEAWRVEIEENQDLLYPLFYNSLDVVFGTCIGLAMDKKLSSYELKFDIVILDEAGKANISESLVSLSMGEKLILVGDHQQLPPYLDQNRLEYFLEHQPLDRHLGPDEVRAALNASFFEFIVELSNQSEHPFPKSNILMLDVQHRMHPDISKFVSDTFYQGQIKNGPKTIENARHLQFPFEKAVTFIDTSSMDDAFESSTGNSIQNLSEAKEIAEKILPVLLEQGVSISDISIVTPYSGQVSCIQSLLQTSEIEYLEDVEVATLDSFQGREKVVIIFSFTRSAPNCKVGFLDNANRLNVAFSRATTKLILVGNAKTLTSPHAHFEDYYTKLFRNLVRHTKDFGTFVGLNDLLKQKIYRPKNRSETKVTVPAAAMTKPRLSEHAVAFFRCKTRFAIGHKLWGEVVSVDLENRVVEVKLEFGAIGKIQNSKASLPMIGSKIQTMIVGYNEAEKLVLLSNF